MSVWGIAKKGIGKALRSYRIKHGKRGKTIKSVKPMSGKIPWHVGKGGKDPAKRGAIVKTHFSLERSRKIEKAEKGIKEGKKTLKDMVDTKQAEELKDYKGKGTGRFYRKGFDK